MRNLEKVDELGNDKYLKLFGFGFLIWLIPLLVSFLFYTSNGELLTSVKFFKSAMTVTGTLVASVLLLDYMKGFTVNYFKESVNAAIVWFLMSIILDLLILVPFAQMDLGNYFADIAFGYLAIPILCIFAGKLLEEKSEHNKKIFSQVFSTKRD